MMCAAARPFCAGGAQCDAGLGLQYRPKGWGNESTRFHKHGELQELVECFICGGSTTGGNSIGCGIDSGGGSGFGSANEPHWA